MKLSDLTPQFQQLLKKYPEDDHDEIMCYINAMYLLKGTKFDTWMPHVLVEIDTKLKSKFDITVNF